MIISYGYVVVASPGTPVPINQRNLNPENQALQSVSVQTKAGNVGAMYIGERNMDRGSGIGVYLVIGAGQQAPLGNPAIPSSLNAALLYLDADNAGDAALVTGVA